MARHCGGAPALPNPTATQSMYELFLCNWGPSTFGATNFTNVFDSFCFPACANINGVDTPYALYNKEFSALYAWSSMGNSATTPANSAFAAAGRTDCNSTSTTSCQNPST